jgi:hypothetical protein
MGITYGDHLVDIGYNDITPEQEREIEAREECARRGIDPDANCADGGIDAWMIVAEELRMKPKAPSECERLSNELDPEIGFPSEDLLRRIHLDVETRGRKNSAFAVSVHHRNIVLSAVAHALRKRDCSWEDWVEACGWPRGSGTCECYRPGDCDGSCTHPKPPLPSTPREGDSK